MSNIYKYFISSLYLSNRHPTATTAADQYLRPSPPRRDNNHRMMALCHLSESWPKPHNYLVYHPVLYYGIASKTSPSGLTESLRRHFWPWAAAEVEAQAQAVSAAAAVTVTLMRPPADSDGSLQEPASWHSSRASRSRAAADRGPSRYNGGSSSCSIS